MLGRDFVKQFVPTCIVCGEVIPGGALYTKEERLKRNMITCGEFGCKLQIVAHQCVLRFNRRIHGLI